MNLIQVYNIIPKHKQFQTSRATIVNGFQNNSTMKLKMSFSYTHFKHLRNAFISQSQPKNILYIRFVTQYAMMIRVIKAMIKKHQRLQTRCTECIIPI